MVKTRAGGGAGSATDDFRRNLVRQVFGAVLVERFDEQVRGMWNGNRPVQRDILRGKLSAVEGRVAAIVRAQSGAFQRNAGKQTS